MTRAETGKSGWSRTVGRDHIINKTFRDTFFVMAVAELSYAISNVIDGLMVSSFLGADAIAAQSMTNPFFGMVGIFSGMLATGTQVTVTRSIGKGDFRGANRFFSTTLFCTILISLIVVPLGLIFRGEVAAVLGAAGEASYLADDVEDYFAGLIVGMFPLMLNAVLIPILQINGDKSRAKFALLASTVTNCIGNLVNVLVFEGGIMGMGIATTFAQVVTLIILLLHFRKNDGICRLSLSGFSFGGLAEIMKIGLPKASKRLCNTLRPLFINRWIIFVGTGAAMSALAVENSLRDFLLMPSSAVAATVVLMTSIYFGEEDKTAMSSLLGTAGIFNIIINIGISLALIISAPLLAEIYISDDAFIAELAVKSLRWFALSIPFTAFNEFYMNFLQGTSRTKAVHALTICEKLVYIVICAYVLGAIFGAVGVYASFFASELLLFITIMLKAWAANGKMPRGISEFMCLPKDFGYDKDDCIEYYVKTEDQIEGISEEIMAFCREKGIDKRRTFYTALCADEMLRNTVEHGFADGKPHGLSMRLVKKGDDLILRIRDDCKLFDIAKKYNEIKDKKDFANIGIKIVMGTCKNLLYVNSLNTNNIIIRF